MDSPEMRKRQERRKLEQKKRIEKQKKLHMRLFWCGLGAIVLTIVCLSIILIAGESEEQSAEAQAPTEAAQPKTVINLAFGGDVNITNRIIESGYTSEGYDYTNIFQDILPALAAADHTIVNLEGNLCGLPYDGTSARAPQEMAQALARAGVDMLQTANSYSINNGMIGLEQTIDNINAAGMEPLGTYGSAQQAQQSGGFAMRNIRGVKVAFVAFTKGMDSMSLPEGKESCVNVLYEDYTSTYQTIDTEGITKVLDNVAAAEPDITIALLHWGSEYNGQTSSTQEKIVSLMKKNGVDAMIGTHSHYVQEIDFDKQTGTLVAYSLGDLLGNADRTRSTYSIILNMQVTKDNATGKTSITGFDYTPIYIDNQETSDGDLTLRLLRIPQAIAEYEAKGMDMVSQESYEAMKAALTKLDKLMTPKEKEE